ncbi:MAG: glutathione S-transferase family protein [Candidatus Binataceae bacterium]
MRGLHLYHFSLSNCSQKTRFCLDEKQLEWTSHEIDLMRKEHFTPEFVSINPKAVVPVLVHDGVVIVESSDIIDYLDKTFPNPPLRPADPIQLDLMYRWLKLWDDTQIHLKTLSHHHLFGRMRADQLRPDMKLIEALIKNDELVDFFKEYTSEQGLSKERVEQAAKWIVGVLGQLDARLADHQWLAGDAFSLADIAWSIDIHRFQLMHFPMEKHQALLNWYKRIESRPSFKKMVLEYEKQVMRQLSAAQSA